MALTPRLLLDAAAGDGKKYTKVVTNPETGRKRRIRYGAKGYSIAPGTDKGDRYCARSFGDMQSEGYDCSGSERNTPLCLSRAKWRCSGKTSRRDGPSTEYYRTHPEAAAKKVRHQAAINRRPEERDRRASLNRERRRRGIAGKGGPDISHPESGDTVLETPSTNRARNGHGDQRRLKADSAEGLTPLTIYGLRRIDAPKVGKGKPCGESFIPRQNQCNKKAGFLTPTSLQTVAKIALAAGLVAGGVTIARKWNAADDSSLQEALTAGKTWDVYEQKRKEDSLDPEVAELREERQARRDRFCGRTDAGKTRAERSDAFKSCSRQVGEQSAYGQLYVHPDGKRLFKVPTGNAQFKITQQESIEASQNEFQHLVLAKQAGVKVPTPISIHPKSGVLQMEYVPNSTTLREFNKTNNSPLTQNQLSDALLGETRRLHRVGIAHNDMHPGNILVTPNKGIILIDFGLAQSLKHSDRIETLSSIKDEMSRVITRAVNIYKNPVAKPEIENWLQVRHSPLLNGLERGTLTNKQLTSGIDSWYIDMRKALQYKVTRPNSILRLNTVL